MTTITAGNQQTISVPEGQVLALSGSDTATGTVYRLNDQLGGTNSWQCWTLGSGGRDPFGPYIGTMRFLIVCSVGTFTATVRTASATQSAQAAGAVGQASMSASQSVTIASDQTALPVREQYSITLSAFPVTAANQQMLPANPNRKYLSWMVVGTQDVTIVPGAGPAVAGAGFIYQASGAGKQGATQEFPHGVPTDAFQCIAAGVGSIVYIWEGA